MSNDCNILRLRLWDRTQPCLFLSTFCDSCQSNQSRMSKITYSICVNVLLIGLILVLPLHLQVLTEKIITFVQSRFHIHAQWAVTWIGLQDAVFLRHFIVCVWKHMFKWIKWILVVGTLLLLPPTILLHNYSSHVHIFKSWPGLNIATIIMRACSTW